MIIKVVAQMSNIHWDDFTNPQDARKLEQFKTQGALKKAPYTSEQLAIILGGSNPTSLRALAGVVGGPFDIAYNETNKYV